VFHTFTILLTATYYERPYEMLCRADNNNNSIVYSSPQSQSSVSITSATSSATSSIALAGKPGRWTIGNGRQPVAER
jgi:hypothetical protein